MRTLRSRRSVLAVPGSSAKMLAKAQGLPVDEAFLDLEDAVAADAKQAARANVVAALNDGDWTGKTRAVRVNDLSTSWTYRDVLASQSDGGQGFLTFMRNSFIVAIGTVVLVAVCLAFFIFMVKAMARIQMPHRLPRD